MPRVTFEVTEDEQRMMIAVCKAKQTWRSELARKWHLSMLKKEYNKLPQSVLDNLAGKGNE